MTRRTWNFIDWIASSRRTTLSTDQLSSSSETWTQSKQTTELKSKRMTRVNCSALDVHQQLGTTRKTTWQLQQSSAVRFRLCLNVDAHYCFFSLSADIFFTRDGHLSQPRYCFQLQAFDMEIKKKHHATSKVCVITIDHPSQDVTTLIRDTATSSTEPQEAPTTKFDQKLYPDEVQLSQSASRFARVAQPLTDTTEVEFTLTANPFGAFDITPTGGIIFIMRPNVLAQALPASTIKIEVTWKQHRQQINVFLKPETTQCSNSTANPTEDFCARHDNQESCQSSCGIGAGNGRCKWRQHEGFELISKVFSTCVPDLNFCSNQECDPLESLASSLNYLVCPQDCSRQVFGNLNTNAVGISGSSKSNVCTCDEFEDCVCGPSNVIEDSTDTTIVVPVIPVIVSDGNKCGDHCLAALIGVLSCSTVIILLLVVFTTCRSRELRTSIESLDSFDSHFNKTSARLAKFEVVHETHSHPDFYSRRWEIDITRVKVERVIGEGEFGKVMLASLKGFHENESTPVVIKTVKNIENDSEMTSLKKEFEQLQKVSIRPHPNVITLLGCYSKGSDPWIFLEYCVFESLKDYLLASRLIPSLIGTDGVDKVTVDDILKFSLQTTNGMAHLAELKLVHRDLAARNVLLFEGKICKVSDFGLTRNVCNKCDTYSKCSDDKVPVKWLAPESLSSSEEYTTKSDVWAFGILGYELIMLGSSPYPTVAANQTEILNFLLNGSRMQRPSNCSNELFRVFESCWAFDPRNRPTFEYLSRKFQELIVLNSYTDQYSLWTTPEFSAAEIQSYDEAYYRNYIQRIDRTRAYFKVQATKKKCVRRNRSSSGEFLKSKSESSTLTPVSNKSLTVSKSLTHINNAGYDGSFDSMKSLLMRHKRENVSNQTKSDLTAVSTSTCSSYLPMSRTQTKVNRSSSFKVTCQVVPSSSSPNITAAGYIPVGDMLGKTNTFKRFSSPMMVETRTQTEN